MKEKLIKKEFPKNKPTKKGFYKEYSWYISDFNNEEPDEYEFDLHIESYEEAELACLTKLIEIVEHKII